LANLVDKLGLDGHEKLSLDLHELWPGAATATGDRKVRIDLLQAWAARSEALAQASDALPNAFLAVTNALLQVLSALKTSGDGALARRARRRGGRGRGRRGRTSTICAEADTLNRLAGGRATLGITGTEGSLVGGRGADQSALLVASSGLESTLRLGSNTRWHVSWASCALAVGGTEGPRDTRDANSLLVGLTAIGGVAIVGLGGGRRGGCWRGGCWRSGGRGGRRGGCWRRRGRRGRTSTICAEADTLNRLAGGLATLGITGTEGSPVRGRGADQSTLLVASSGLESTLRLGGNTRWHVSWASCALAVGGAEGASNTRDTNSLLVGEASIAGVAIVGVARSRRRGRRSRRSWCGGGRRARRTRRTHGWVRWLHGDATLARSGGDVLGQHDVSTRAPGWAPAVLNLPVGLAPIGAIADDEDTMVELGATGAREHPSLVELEARLVSFDGDRNRSLLDSSHELGLAVLLNILEANNFD